jgi:hypothetical protein
MSKTTHFIILVGGPGTFESCDRAHDQTWKNYIVPIQVAVQNKQLAATAAETMQWWVYAPAYSERWTDDLKDTANAKLDRGKELLDSRGRDIANVRRANASDYLDRIARMAKSSKASFKALNSVGDFWKELQALPDRSVSRLWYIGHASSKGLMLKLMHDSSCAPAAQPSDMILVSDLATNSGLISAKLAAKPGASKFYGCYTKDFAEQWNTRFGSATEGTTTKIDFGLIDAPSKIKEVLPRLEAGTDWRRFRARP